MKLVIQRVNHASVTVEGKVTGEIKKGYLVLLGVGQGDDESMVERYVKKLHKLRIFSDEEGKINRSIDDVGGEVLVVSQFTLYADCKKGNRPSFTAAARPETAIPKLYAGRFPGRGRALIRIFFRGVPKRIWQSRAWYFWSRDESITRK